MLGTVIAIVAVLFVLHLIGGAHHHAKRRARGMAPRLYYTYGSGWYGSMRLPGGFRIGHRV